MSIFQQFYVEPQNVHKNHFVLTGDEFRHATKALRHREGDWINAVDGLGNRYSGTILDIEKSQIQIKLEKKVMDFGEPKLHLVLAHSVPKGSHFDLVVEKGTEIGISEFQPILTKYSIVNPQNRIDRWQQKVLAAMKQCGRSKCPLVNQPIKFEKYLDIIKNETAFIAHEMLESGGNMINLDGLKKAVILIGPEGGFSDEEVQLALDKGIQPLSLGERRLRSETAGLAAAAKLLHISGDLG